MLNLTNKTFIRDLGDGLVLRRSSPEDAEKLYNFNATIFGEDGPDERIGQWVWDLLKKPHPTFGANDFTIVEETATGRIVSSLNLISQTWQYEGIPFGVGRPELVATLPEFRRRGLVLMQFEEIHRWSAERGELVQAITGIPFYYRQFGYEMCVDLDGSRSGFEPNLPKLEESGSEPYRLRPAVESDIAFLSEVSAYAARRSLLYVERDEALWRLELNGRSEKNVNRLIWNIIERAGSGEAVGFLAHPWYSLSNSVPAYMYELMQGVSWLDVSPSVARWLWNLGKTICEQEGKACLRFNFALAGNHPVYTVLEKNLSFVRGPYAWYMRVPDLPAFIWKIAPVLEKRLSASFIPGYSGELRINSYTCGLQLVFTNGRLSAADSWQPDTSNIGDISFPNQTFLQMLFGHRTLDDLKKSYTDCLWDKHETYLLVNTLFPRKPSQFMGIV